MYEIRVYLFDTPGYFTYKVEGKTRAMIHLGEIKRTGYRRHDVESDRFVWYSPQRISEVQVIGPDLESNYPDKFIRT